MKKRYILLTLLGLLLPAVTFARSENARYKEGQLLVRFSDTVKLQKQLKLTGPLSRHFLHSSLAGIISQGAAIGREYDDGTPDVVLVKLPKGKKVQDEIVNFVLSGAVQYAEPDFICQLAAPILTFPDDPYILSGDQWALWNTGGVHRKFRADIHAPEAWTLCTGIPLPPPPKDTNEPLTPWAFAPSVVVAVMDTGIDYTHLDIRNDVPEQEYNMWVNPIETPTIGGKPNGKAGFDDDHNGYKDDIYGVDVAGNDANNAKDADSDPMDVDGHGTHVAGIIGARGANRMGVTGVNWRVKLMAVKIFADNSTGALVSDIHAGFSYILMHNTNPAYPPTDKVRIVNGSWVFPPGTLFSEAQTIYSDISSLNSQGVLYVAAAGNGDAFGRPNDNDKKPIYPASFNLPNVISVMATGPRDEAADYSNFGKTTVHLAAPGGNTEPYGGDSGAAILSTLPGNSYGYMEGTSMAAPFVSGAAALIWAMDYVDHNDGAFHLPMATVKGYILAGVDVLDNLDGLCVTSGRLNLFNSVNMERRGQIRNTRTLHLSSTFSDAINNARNGDTLIVASGYTYFDTIDLTPSGSRAYRVHIRSGDTRPQAAPTWGVTSPSDTIINGYFTSAGTDMIKLGGRSDANAIIEGLTIVSGPGTGIKITNVSSPVIIDDCNITRNASTGIYCSAANVIIKNSSAIARNKAGGIKLLSSSTATISNTSISKNVSSDKGAGINASSSTITMSSSTVSDNNSLLAGGGIYSSGTSTVTVTDSQIQRNKSRGDGGGISLNTTVAKLTRCEISDNNNATTSGGGVFSSTGSNLDVNDCNIHGNMTMYRGGGVYCASTANIHNKTRLNYNKTIGNDYDYQFDGGGIYLDGVSPTITDCNMTGNVVAGGGGGAYLNGASPVLRNCVVTNNLAADTGGGISCDSSQPTIKNCLITGNQVQSWDGGGIWMFASNGTVQNCTIANNTVLNYVQAYGSGIFCDAGSSPLISDCIFYKNLNSPAIYEFSASSDPTTRYNLFFGNAAGDYFDYDKSSVRTGASQINSIADGKASHNIDGTPLFVKGRLGSYYLSQSAAGQLHDSNAVNAGSVTAASLGLGTPYSTRTDTQGDAGQVDLGYHYLDKVAPRNCDVTFIVTGHGTINPSGTQSYKRYTQVQVTATPNSDAQFKAWHNTDDDARLDIDPTTHQPYTVQYNIVTVDDDKTVTAEFQNIMVTLVTSITEGQGTIDPSRTTTWPRGSVVPLNAMPADLSKAIIWQGTNDDYSTSRSNKVTLINSVTRVYIRFYTPKFFYFPGQYPQLQAAIDAAGTRDIVQISTGRTVTSQGFFVYKPITITGTNPDDPCTVSATSIEQQTSTDGYVYRGFTFTDVGRNAVLDGVTLRGFRGHGGDGLTPSNPQPGDPGGSGESWWGQTISCDNASPTIKNCLITDGWLRGGNGATGVAGSGTHLGGGEGGFPGGAYGAGLACVNHSNPAIINTTFRNCTAQGGNGGDGGNGASPSGFGGPGGGWTYGLGSYFHWYYWRNLRPDIDGNDLGGTPEYFTVYSGRGGAVYVSHDCAPTFTDCNFINNTAEGGKMGICGVDHPENAREEPSLHWKIDDLGGAVFCSKNSNVKFIDCTFSKNLADPNRDPNIDDTFTSYGGAIAFEEGATVSFEKCLFTENKACVGGAVHSSMSNMYVDKCDFEKNAGFFGGAILFVGGTGEIANSTIAVNTATGSTFQDDLIKNLSGYGGGIASLGSNASITDSQIHDNFASGSGGGIYISSKDVNGQDLSSNDTVLLKNCLIVHNGARHDGGGVSSNWYSDPNIVNCTIANNSVTGVGFTEGRGGGVACSYGNYTNIINSIIYGNQSVDPGSQLSAATSAIASTAKVTYTDLQLPPSQTVPPLDLALCVDATGSMGGDINDVKHAMSQIVTKVSQSFPDYRIGIASYTDYNNVEGTPRLPGNPYSYHDVVPFTKDLYQILSDINDFKMGGGGDFPEAVYTGLMHCMNAGALITKLRNNSYGDWIDPNSPGLGAWRTGSTVKRVIVLIGDANAHDPDLYTRYRLGDIATEAAVLPITIITVPVRAYPPTVESFSQIADATGGYTLPVDNNQVDDAVLAVVKLIMPHDGIYTSTGSSVKNWDATNKVWTGTIHNLNIDPLFAQGYHLSSTSPCIDKGSTTATAMGFYKHTTQTNNALDTGTVDLGFHYSLDTASMLLGDFNFDGKVDDTDFLKIRDNWLKKCEFPDWCNGTDLNQDGIVNFLDDGIFENVLRYGPSTDLVAPQPNPLTWYILPKSVGPTSISMTATTAYDNYSGYDLTYRFACTAGGSHDSGWQTATTWTDTGLTTGTGYSYHTKAKDKKGNETTWSTIYSAVAGEDKTPPTPDPAQWATPPYATSASSIKMTAVTETDASGGVQYFFDCTTTGGHDSTWQTSATYEDKNLTSSTRYYYRVRAKDAFGNSTAWSGLASATPSSGGGTIDNNAPTPNPATWVVSGCYQHNSGGITWYHRLEATVGTDSTGPVQYYFQAVAGFTASPSTSGWQTDPFWDRPVGNGARIATYKVKMRDSKTPTPNEGQWSAPIQVQ